MTDPHSGDVIDLLVADNINFTGSLVTVDVGFVATNPVTLSSTTLTDGTYYARARILRGAVYSGWSNVVVVTIATFTVRQFGLPGFTLNSTGGRTYGLPGMTVTET